ncbi:TPA: type IV conjugative transfer system coupling protein TraD [Legionella pneumophila]|uniref:DNA transport protein TraD n=1 Tax=Fluoribacter dumoffii TaxID=463 RepID=A0A377ITU9_9GAMM|nr:type IV conjugative transfer system coupling protein TraD [Fluoribacter dumoffii]STO91629.1 DNA transport protein TraD [Fluoribacter dumoffii]HAT1865085.1 type IV conjugative transfer system coupling protein TraD [Legionella pneumophila]HAT4388956.1 type IV conjugative transfer system coupling protein TraD [Legionella pneumophila]HEM7045357.1 type IV conjugative transfer system coupling protein TraD [Legionella pneumophila]
MSKDPNFKHYTRGGQISFHNLRMWDQITKTLSMICLFLWVVFTVFFAWIFIPLEKITHAIAFYYAQFLSLVGQKHSFELSFHGKAYQQTVDSILHYSYYQDNANHVVNSLGKSAFWAFCLSFILGLGLAYYFIKRGKAQSDSQFVRGSQLKNSNEVRKKILRDKAHSDIMIDQFPLIRDSEVQHILVHGTVGTGKSQLIMKIMDCLRKRGDRVIVYDKGCSFIPHYYQDESDVILNPFDKRCANWDMWLEAPRDSDFENMAESSIPMHGESDPFWVNASRTVFSCLGSVMRHHSDRSLDKFLKLILTDEFSELEEYLQGTPAATLVSGKIEKTAISIRATLTTYLKSFSALAELNQEGKPPFSIRDYILDEQQKGWLFISSNGETHKSLKPLISMWLAQASLALLSLTPDRNRRIWFICDELPSLHKLPLLGETIAEIRKFGGCFLLGMQSFSQLTKVYGQAGSKEIFDLLNTRFFFRSPSSDMARLVAAELGEEEIEESRENYSYGANSIRDGISLGAQRVTRPIVSYPQIMELKDLHCFVRLPGHYPITQLALDLGFRTTKTNGFIERSMPTTFNFSQLTSFDDNLESGTNGHMGNDHLIKNKINTTLQCIEELNLKPL